MPLPIPGPVLPRRGPGGAWPPGGEVQEGQRPSWTRPCLRRLLPAIAAIALAALGGHAAAAQDWRAAAPGLPLDGVEARLDGPVEVTRAGWGPFRRICREQGVPGRASRRDCRRVEEAVREPGGWRLRIAPEGEEARRAPSYRFFRGDDGRVSGVEVLVPQGEPTPSAEQRQSLAQARQAELQAFGLTQMRVLPGAEFSVGLPGSEGSMRCVPEGRGTIAARPVLVARCAVELGGRLRGGEAEARIAIAGKVAVDIETGLMVAQGYATRIETFALRQAAPPRSNGVTVTPSRVVIE